jgi:hypothetical protein
MIGRTRPTPSAKQAAHGNGHILGAKEAARTARGRDFSIRKIRACWHDDPPRAAGPLPRSAASAIVGIMSTRRPLETTPDLFSASATAKAAEPSASRHFLPEDLAEALKRLDNAEIDALLDAVITEAERRGRSQSKIRQAPAASLTTGKLNAVRAALKAGVKPSAIARQFGISHSDVKTALATESRDRKSGR